MKKGLECILLLLILSFYCSCSSPSSRKVKEAKEGFFLVTKVIDGDTFWIDDGSQKGIKVRLIGVDSPETRNTGNKVVGYFGVEAKKYATELLSGKKVRLEYDLDRYDQYGRTLAYVYLKDGTFINAELVEKGYAMVATFPPNVKYEALFLKLQQAARENNRGLWNK